MENNMSLTTSEDDNFCAVLAKTVPALVSLWNKYMNHPTDERLPYMFMADAAQWAEANALEHEEDVHRMISVLNEGLDEGEGDVPNLIAAGFVEAMSRDTPFLALVTGSLKAWVDYDFGFSSVQPQLRGQ
ncbi:hypothetical protein G7068_04555 [Leucobacter viscericola]|uniref:DUF7674 domain-containing protein n=1 Tax=Leucobacter viscericola TaxID=2714935 RepID=A0A6G7XD78_9MICO|nr:hypothetical protein [Leucobacter viscericola]QIK62560.1 hypothetical protein G7068_04555 [Leucobacter viscericola]